MQLSPTSDSNSTPEIIVTKQQIPSKTAGKIVLTRSLNPRGSLVKSPIVPLPTSNGFNDSADPTPSEQPPESTIDPPEPTEPPVVPSDSVEPSLPPKMSKSRKPVETSDTPEPPTTIPDPVTSNIEPEPTETTDIVPTQTEDMVTSVIESTGSPTTDLIFSTDPVNSKVIIVTRVSTPIFYQTIVSRRSIATVAAVPDPSKIALGNAPAIAGVIFGILGAAALGLFVFMIRSRRQMRKNTSEPIPFLLDSLDQPNRRNNEDDIYPVPSLPMPVRYVGSPLLDSLDREGFQPIVSAFPTPSYILTNGEMGIAYSSNGAPLFSIPMGDRPLDSPNDDLEANRVQDPWNKSNTWISFE